MAREPDPLLLELFESVQGELAAALEALARRGDADKGAHTAGLNDGTIRVDNLRKTLAALECALDLAQSRFVH